MRMRRLALGRTRASESRHGESDGSEEVAGVVVAGAGAFLIGHAVVGSLNEKLSRSYYSDNREDTEGDVDSGTVAIGAKLTVENAVYSVGELVALTAAITSARTFLNLSTENYGLYSLYDSRRLVITNGIEVTDIAVVVIGCGGIGCNCAFSSVKNNVLLKRSNTLEGLASAYSEARLKLKEYVISDVYLIEAVVKRNFVYTYVRPKYLCTFGLNVGSGSENVLTESGKIYAHILEAISVTATVENPFGVDAHRSSQILVTSEGSVSIFLHCNFSSFKVLKSTFYHKDMVCYIICF